MLVSYIKKSLHTTLVYGFSAALGRGINFLFLPFFLSKLTLAELGCWDFYQTWQSLGSMVISSCATISIIRFLVLYKDDSSRSKAIIGNSFLLIIMGIFLLSTVWFVGVLLRPQYLPNTYTTLTLLNIVGSTLFYLVITYFRSNESLLSYLGIFLLQNFLMILCTVVGVYKGYGILSFFYGNLISLMPPAVYCFYLLITNFNFSLPLLYEQFIYSLPIMLASFLFNLFMVVDRFFLNRYAGVEELGWYSLLWRFTAIFQLLSVTIADTWPIILFNAHKEEKSTALISKLVIYFCLVLLSGYLVGVVGARLAIALFLPCKYHRIIDLLPLGFLPIVTLSVAQLFNVGFGLTKKTFIMPFISLAVLGLQTLLLFIYGTSIESICSINACAFMLYALLNYCLGSYFYTTALSDTKVLIRLIILFLGYVLLLNYLFIYRMPWYLSSLCIITWPLALGLSGILKQEIGWVYKHFSYYTTLFLSPLRKEPLP